ncbi:hypothetical protein EWM64_g3326 [Hericium alpestre]|uniref:Uncharacterized protein n=1 Tax=Hericium alpestre TaxID=135208 RepID=A0A4Z0A0M8_9AGAM|nr:hypothetical protein EWM64_g3326 [Hericium alpestre]
MSRSGSSSSSSPSCFTGLTTPPDSPVVSTEVVHPSLPISPVPIFHSDCLFNTAENEQMVFDVYSTDGDAYIKNSHDVFSARGRYETPAYNAGAFQPAQQEVFQEYSYPAQQLPMSMAPMDAGSKYAYMHPSFAKTVAASPPPPSVEQQSHISMPQMTMGYAVYPCPSAEYINTFAVPLDQPQAEPELEFDYSNFDWESDPAFNAEFDNAVAAWASAPDSTVQTMMFVGTDWQWMNGMQFASY